MAVLVVYLARLTPLVEQVDKLVRQTQHLGILWIYYYIIIYYCIIMLYFYYLSAYCVREYINLSLMKVKVDTGQNMFF